MKLRKMCIAAFLLATSSTGVVSAQESDSSKNNHPFLSDTFNIGLGVFRPSLERKIEADSGKGIGGSLEENDTQSTGILSFRWRYSKNWSFWATHWQTDSENQQLLTEDFDLGDDNGTVFLKGSTIGSGIDVSITRLFFGRSFFRRPSTDWGVGVGLHWLDMKLFVEGDIKTSPQVDPPLKDRVDYSGAVPLPNLGIWYTYSWSPKWVVNTRLDWLDITIDEFSGSLFDASVGVNYQMSKHFGIGLAVNAFRLDVKVDSPKIRAGIEMDQIGPRLNITWNW